MLRINKSGFAAVVSAVLMTSPAFAEDEGRGVFVSNPDRNGFNINHAQAEFDVLKNRIAEHRIDKWCYFNGFEAFSTSHDKRHVHPCRIAPGFVAVYYATQNAIEIFRAEGDRMIKLHAVVFYSAEKERLADFDAIRKAFDIAPDE